MRNDTPSVIMAPLTCVTPRRICASVPVATDRKTLGLYYTPRWLAELISNWALQKNIGDVFDPCFGGCAFLTAALQTLKILGARRAAESIFGVDIDPRAMRHARGLFAAGVPRQNVIVADFLRPSVGLRNRQFRVVVGNPPYVRHHKIKDEMIDCAQSQIRHLGVALPRLASLWAYFTIIAASLVEHGGNLGFVLPGSVLQAYFAQPVLDFVSTHFGQVRLVHLQQRVFENADEETVLLLASDKGNSTASIRYQYVANPQELPSALASEANDLVRQGNSHKLALISPDIVDAWRELRTQLRAKPLGEFCRVRIGTVTGSNDFFIRPSDDPILKTHVHSVPIVTRNRWLRAPIFSTRNLRSLEKAGEATRLLLIQKADMRSLALRREIDRASRLGIANRAHCRRRDPWYEIDDLEVPELFMPYLGAVAPNLVANRARARCTNAIHRIWRKGKEMSVGRLVTLSYSSIFAFECEMFGRSYGGGILKLEPSEVRLIHIPETVPDGSNELERASSQEERVSIANRLLSSGDLRRLRFLEILEGGASVLRAVREGRRSPFILNTRFSFDPNGAT